MIIIKSIMVLIGLLVVPAILGNIVTERMNEKFHGHLLYDWVFGIVLMFAQLQLMAVPMIISNMPFHTLFYIYVAIVLLEAVLIAFHYEKVILEKLNSFVPHVYKVGFLGGLVLLSILMQGFMLSYFEHVDDDDARFVPSAVAAVEKDMMFEENPVTGEMMYSRISEVFKDMVSPWIMFWAIISKISGIHPAILMHSVVPLIFIPLAYAVYWILSGMLFAENEREKKIIFVGIVSAINIFSGYSVYNSGAFLLLRIWQGKALFAAIFVPLIITLAINLFTNEVGKEDYRAIAITSCGACLTSGFGIILSAMFWGIVSIIYGIAKKSFRKMFNIWLTLIPCVVYGLLYAFGAELFK